MPPGRRCSVGAAAAGLALLAAVSVGCAGSGGDKAGGPDDRTIVLTLAAGDPTDAFVNFAAAVESESRGALRIVARVGWRASSPDPERARIADVRSGAVDLAEVGAGAWDAVGVTSFRALVAPLLIDALALQARVLETSSIATMLEGVRPLGLVGLAVLPGELRRPFGATRPLVAPKDYSGARLPAAHDVAAATWEALGGDPVDSSAAVRLDGAAHDLPTIEPAGSTCGRTCSPRMSCCGHGFERSS